MFQTYVLFNRVTVAVLPSNRRRAGPTYCHGKQARSAQEAPSEWMTHGTTRMDVIGDAYGHRPKPLRDDSMHVVRALLHTSYIRHPEPGYGG